MALIFLVSFAAIAYAYLGYPLAIWALARLRTRKVSTRSPEQTDPETSVSVVIACHNEVGSIEKRLANLLESDYPRDLLEIVVVSDGSTDDTLERAAAYSSVQVRTAGYQDQKGKASALNLGVSMAGGQIIVFADARQTFAPDAVSNLVAAFDNPSVGAVTGELILRDDHGSSIADGAGFYWKYEKWIRKNEARFDSCIGATGAIFAIRRELWSELPVGTILDDVYTPMRIALAGHRVAFEERAIAYDNIVDSATREFSRKARTLLGNYQLCQLMPELLVPTHRLAIQFYSHKVMRLVAPLFLMLILISNLAICVSSDGVSKSAFYTSALGAQITFYLSVLAGWALSGRARRPRLLNAAYVFSLMNAAAIVGLIYFVTGKQDVWAGVNRR